LHNNAASPVTNMSSRLYRRFPHRLRGAGIFSSLSFNCVISIIPLLWVVSLFYHNYNRGKVNAEALGLGLPRSELLHSVGSQ
jgi:hypothetical protein